MEKYIFNWNEKKEPNLIIDESNFPQKYSKIEKTPIFSPNSNLNKRIFITQNKIITICGSNYFQTIDALLLQIPKKHLIQTPSNYRINIIQNCGEEIYKNLSENPFLSPGECLLTSAFKFPGLKYLIHCALPKFSKSYSEASLSALHLSIRNAIDVCCQNDIKKIIIGEDIFKPTENFPINLSIEVVLRTFRKCLEELYDYFTHVIICINDGEILNRVVFFLKIFFPRNVEEQNNFNCFIPPNLISKYGDIILSERNIHIEKNIKETKYFEEKKTNEFDGFFLEDENKIFNDNKRISEIFKEEIDYSKKFYYDNIKLFDEEIESKFDDMNFLHFKGTDFNKRQIFFVYLKQINFDKLENYKLENYFLLYCYNYIKNNFQKQKIFSIIFFCNNLEKINFPHKNIIDSIEKLSLSNSVLNSIQIDKINVILLKPNFLFKCYFQFIKVFIKNILLDKIRIIENYEDFNKEFFMDLDDGIEKRIQQNLERNKNIFEELFKRKNDKENENILQKNMFNEIYFHK